MSGNYMSSITLIVLFLMFLSIARGKMKKVTLVGMLLMPVLFTMSVSEVVMKIHPITAIMIFDMIVFVLLGFAVGIYRGSFCKFEVDENGIFRYGNTYASLIFYTIIIALKWGLEFFSSGQNPSLSGMISISLLCFSLGSIIGRRIFILSKYVKMINQGQ